jgi:hypothetical protein
MHFDKAAPPPDPKMLAYPESPGSARGRLQSRNCAQARMEAVGGSKEPGSHWSRIGLCNDVVRLDTIAAHAGTLANFRAESASAIRHRGSQLDSPDAQCAWCGQSGVGRRSAHSLESNPVDRRAMRGIDQIQHAHSVERRHRGRHQAFAARLVRRRGAALEYERAQTVDSGCYCNGESSWPTAGDKHIAIESRSHR